MCTNYSTFFNCFTFSCCLSGVSLCTFWMSSPSHCQHGRSQWGRQGPRRAAACNPPASSFKHQFRALLPRIHLSLIGSPNQKRVGSICTPCAMVKCFTTVLCRHLFILWMDKGDDTWQLMFNRKRLPPNQNRADLDFPFGSNPNGQQEAIIGFPFSSCLYPTSLTPPGKIKPKQTNKQNQAKTVTQTCHMNCRWKRKYVPGKGIC